MPPPPVTSNTSRSAPPASTGSALLNLISDTSTALVHLESRFDPFIRPLFDAVLRDPVARLVTALINLRRPNEGLAIAEERPIPDEEAHLQSIIDSFTAQMKGLWKPGGFERGGNTKTHGMVPRRVRGARQPARAAAPRRLRRARPPLQGLGALLGAGARTSRPTSKTSAS